MSWNMQLKYEVHMNGQAWLWIALLAILILCCVLPMLFMSRRGRGGMNEGNGRKHSETKP